MILSMTGFGASERHEAGVSWRVEIRSLNNRYFKAAIKLPESLGGLETVVEKRLRDRVGRGSITFSLTMKDESPAAASEINVAALRAYADRLLSVGKSLGLNGAIDLAALVTLPGVAQARTVDANTLATFRTLVESLTDAAVSRLVEMRQVEGAALRNDLLSQCEKLRALVAQVRQRGPRVVEEYQQKLRARVNALMAANELSLKADDLIREIAIFADRSDVNEELTRLDGHLDHFAALCDVPEEAGRKLDFLAQEMLREANTVGSKANDGSIARLVVDMKTIIDRIKEQVQNVE
ncbi:MAG: YicC/YloC family endoribonuclease [Phycisphaerae bacterium]